MASSTNSAGIAVTVTSAASAGNNANGGVTMLSPASSSTQLNAAAAADGDSAASMEPLRQALQDAVRYGETEQSWPQDQVLQDTSPVLSYVENSLGELRPCITTDDGVWGSDRKLDYVRTVKAEVDN